MTCQEAKTIVDGYVDGELSPVHNRVIEEHLERCPACSQIYRSHQLLRSSMRAGSLYRTAPVSLQKRIRASLPSSGNSATRVLHGIPMGWRWVGVAASVVLVAVLTWRLVLVLESPAAAGRLIEEVTANHVRSLMVAHLVDIPSSDRHVVKPWFTGKLDFAPSVPDLTQQGFPLIGGRLDYLDHRVVAAIVYKRREHVINVFVWPAVGSGSGESKSITHQGYHHLTWSDSHMTYWVVSDLNDRELQEFARLLQGDPSKP